MLDEVAHAAGRDPYELRRELLAEHPRELALLDLVARQGRLGQPAAAGCGAGAAAASCCTSRSARWSRRSPRSRCGTTARSRSTGSSARSICGIVVNPDTIDAQMRGGIVFGLSAALMQKITIEQGRVVEANFDSYPLATMTDMPAIEVHIAPSGEAAGGIGEPATPPVAPALGNAIFAATGKRIRTLPIGEIDLPGCRPAYPACGAPGVSPASPRASLALPLPGPRHGPVTLASARRMDCAILAARLNSAGFIFRETSKTGGGRADNLDKRGAS